MKPQSVRSQRSFQEHMKTVYQNIDNQLYSAEMLCGKLEHIGCMCIHKERECSWKSKMSPECELYICKLHSVRVLLGEHFVHSDITIPPDTTQADLKEKR